MIATAQHYVFDASAVLAYLGKESGYEEVKNLLHQGSFISAINWAEVLKVLFDSGQPPTETIYDLQVRNILGRLLIIEPFDAKMAQETASLNAITKPYGLSLADRACLALGNLLQCPVVTADRAWAKIQSNLVPRCILIR
jgi:ribonuclease VapC